jgi:STE24 endopeptidase
MEPLPYLQLTVAFIFVVNILHTYLDVRQLRAIKKQDPPATLKGLFSDELYQQAQAYSIDKWWFGFVHGLYNLAETLAVLWFQCLPWLWAKLPEHIPLLARHGEIVHTVAFVITLSLISTVMGLPWSLYSTFVIEEKHGFNKQTLQLFFTDIVKTLLLGAVMLPPIIAGITWILLHSGPWMPLQLWAFTFVLSVFFMTIYPTVIAPLFNKFDPLPEGSLRAKIEELAGSLKFPLKKLFTMDGSKRSAHSNAYFTGIWEKRIVLFDSLIQQCSEAQVVAVLAHELGHWKLRHLSINFIMGSLIMLCNFLLLAAIRTAPGLYEAFGFKQDKPALIALLLFSFLVSPMDEVIGFLTNLVSRAFEYQADNFAVKLGKGQDLRDALLKLEETNKASLNFDPLYSVYHHSHPHISDRLGKIDEALKKGQ